MDRYMFAWDDDVDGWRVEWLLTLPPMRKIEKLDLTCALAEPFAVSAVAAVMPKLAPVIGCADNESSVDAQLMELSRGFDTCSWGDWAHVDEPAVEYTRAS